MTHHSTQDPIVMFQTWLEHAIQHPDIPEPHAVCVATANGASYPSARMTLLDHVDERGFVFFTNNKSHKGTDLSENPFAALCFYWIPLNRQVRARGSTEIVKESEADTFFAAMDRDKQIMAWASQQSQDLESRSALQERVDTLHSTYEQIDDVPRPPHWSGYRVRPDTIEFWIAGDKYMHDRWAFKRNVANQWEKTLLYP